jgi:aminopeptidase N
MRWRLAAVALLVAAGCASAVATTAPRGSDVVPVAPPLGPDTRDFDQIDLALDLSLDMERGSLTGTATHTMASLRDGLDKVRLHLADMKVEKELATPGK